VFVPPQHPEQQLLVKTEHTSSLSAPLACPGKNSPAFARFDAAAKRASAQRRGRFRRRWQWQLDGEIFVHQVAGILRKTGQKTTAGNTPYHRPTPGDRDHRTAG